MTSETPEGSVFELTAGKAPEGRPRGSGRPPPPTTPEGWICKKTTEAQNSLRLCYIYRKRLKP
jgi:hypothetical protein